MLVGEHAGVDALGFDWSAIQKVIGTQTTKPVEHAWGWTSVAPPGAVTTADMPRQRGVCDAQGKLVATPLTGGKYSFRLKPGFSVCPAPDVKIPIPPGVAVRGFTREFYITVRDKHGSPVPGSQMHIQSVQQFPGTRTVPRRQILGMAMTDAQGVAVIDTGWSKGQPGPSEIVVTDPVTNTMSIFPVEPGPANGTHTQTLRLMNIVAPKTVEVPAAPAAFLTTGLDIPVWAVIAGAVVLAGGVLFFVLRK